jgi:hypothetical protein
MGLGRIALKDECSACMTLLSKFPLHWRCKVCGRLLVMGWW